MTDSSRKIAVIGLGYVGLPLARLFATKYKTIGYDNNPSRVRELMMGHDSTMELSDCLLNTALKNGFKCTTDITDIKDCNTYIVTVPTPVDTNNNPGDYIIIKDIKRITIFTIFLISSPLVLFSKKVLNIHINIFVTFNKHLIPINRCQSSY